MPNKIKESSINLEFDDNVALINLFGHHDQNLLLIEKLNGVSINRIGNKVNIKGDLKTIGVGAEGLKAGFTRTFAEFEALRKAGMTQTQARQMYSGAQSVIDVGARAGGRDIDISVVEQAALGSKEAQDGWKENTNFTQTKHTVKVKSFISCEVCLTCNPFSIDIFPSVVVDLFEFKKN